MIEACEIKTTHDKEPDFVMLNETIVPPPANIGAENSLYLDTGQATTCQEKGGCFVSSTHLLLERYVSVITL